MGLLHRLGYYLGGFSVGLVLLFFLFNGKRTQCNYGPQARVINDLSKKKWIVDTLRHKDLDSLEIKAFLSTATIDFGSSNTQLDSCKVYVLRRDNSSPSNLIVQNCSKKVIVVSYN